MFRRPCIEDGEPKIKERIKKEKRKNEKNDQAQKTIAGKTVLSL